MSLAPLLDAAPVIQVHAFAAMGAFTLGAIQLAAPKGTLPHRTIGWIWAGLMLMIAGSSFLIHSIRLWGPFSPIHLLPIAVLRAHRHQVERHRRAMLGLFFGALVIAGAFTFLPGRIMHELAFGP